MRVSASFTPTQIDFRDDTGVGSVNAAVEREGVADLNVLVVSAEAITAVLDRGAFAPFTIVGVSVGRWAVDELTSDVPILGNRESVIGFGGTGGVGVRISPTPALSFRLEAVQYRLGNPFDGRDGWRVLTGTTYDEPDTVRSSRYRAVLSYAVGG